MSRGVLSWFCKFLTYGGEVIEYWEKKKKSKTNYKGIWAHSWNCWKALSD